jgi:AcrR family transcriptional regulator
VNKKIGKERKPRAQQKGPKKSVRRRRTAEEARRLILEAAEKRLISGGMEAIRLQDIAADVGMAHAVISHHFGNREGLMEALTRYASDRFQETVTRVLATESVGNPANNRLEQIHHAVEVAAREIVDQGYGRLWAWLVVSGRDWRTQVEGMFGGLARIIHAFRVQWSVEDGQPPPDMEDTRFWMILGFRMFIGEAFSGPYAQLSVGLPGDEETEHRFRLWLSRVAATYRSLASVGTKPKSPQRRPAPK